MTQPRDDPDFMLEAVKRELDGLRGHYRELVVGRKSTGVRRWFARMVEGRLVFLIDQIGGCAEWCVTHVPSDPAVGGFRWSALTGKVYVGNAHKNRRYRPAPFNRCTLLTAASDARLRRVLPHLLDLFDEIELAYTRTVIADTIAAPDP